MSCAKRLCLSQFRVQAVDRNDWIGANYYGTLNGVEAHAASADDDDALPRANVSGVDDCPKPGYDTTAQQGSPIQRHVWQDRDNLRLVDHGKFGKGSGPKAVLKGFAPMIVETTLSLQRKTALA